MPFNLDSLSSSAAATTTGLYFRCPSSKQVVPEDDAELMLLEDTMLGSESCRDSSVEISQSMVL